MTRSLLALTACAVVAALIGTGTGVGGASTSAQTRSEIDYYRQSGKVETACGPDGGVERRPPTMTKLDILCVNAGEGFEVDAEQFEAESQDNGWWKLTVSPFSWDGKLPQLETSFTVEPIQDATTTTTSTTDTAETDESPSTTTPVAVDPIETAIAIVPDVRLTARVEQHADVDDGEDTETSDEQAAADTSGETASETAGPVIVTTRPVTKTIQVTGTDADIAGLRIREQIKPGLTKVSIDGEVVSPAAGQETIELEIEDQQAVYQLSIADGSNGGQDLFTQRSDLVFGEHVLWSTTVDVTLDAPRVEVEVQAGADDVTAGSVLEVTITVSNLRNRAVEGPLEILLEVTEGDGLVETLRDASAESDEPNDATGTVSGNTITWVIDNLSGQPAKEDRKARIELKSTSSDEQLVFVGRIGRQGVTVPIERQEAKVDVSGSDGASEGVDFSPEQLIRLIAFVMAFALVAIIFGAWSRRSGDTPTKEDRGHELELFRAYTETILVLVILVAILVLALQRSLSGESAASLIGVIAGYALGRSMGGPR